MRQGSERCAKYRPLAPSSKAISFIILPAIATIEFVSPVLAQSGTPAESADSLATMASKLLLQGVSLQDLVLMSITLGVTAFGVIAGILYTRVRVRLQKETRRLETETANLRHRLDHAEALLATEDTTILTWNTNGRAEVQGTFTGIATSACDVSRVLDYQSWLRPASADDIARVIDALRSKGESFNLILQNTDGTPIEADGRVRFGRAIVRFRYAYGQRAKQGEIEAERELARREISTIRSLLAHGTGPAWARDTNGAVVWANEAYAALSRHVFNGESGEGRDLMTIAALTDSGPENGKPTPAGLHPAESRIARLSVKADNRINEFDLIEYPFEGGAFGFGQLRQVNGSKSKAASPPGYRMFNQLGTGIILFNDQHKLIFANKAFGELFDIDARWTMPGAHHSQILDALREAQNLPPEPDYRAWKAERLAAYSLKNTDVDLWHLPDGRTLRVVADPQPGGGLTCLFEDETERLTLESRFNALMRLQKETLENMREAVAVFSSDGRMNFSNPAYAKLWNIDADRLSSRPHIEKVITACKPLFSDDATWMTLRHAVTDVADNRAPLQGRMDRTDGLALDYTTVPLPDGATLVTFADMSDQVAGERVLRQRNTALEAAAELKNSFIQHVSYELRTPLTSVIGFAELLGNEATGSLVPKQAEYVDHILASSDSLLAIINNILDLATIDAGAMELEFDDVDILTAIEAAANGIRPRLKNSEVKLHVQVQENLGTFRADSDRVRQVLFNLLSNAIGFSEQGQTITLTCDQMDGCIRFQVIDQGRGIDPGDFHEVFDRFVTKSAGTTHRGAGLGLSIVKSFVELHGGDVTITSMVGEGTTVVCMFPIDQPDARTVSPDHPVSEDEANWQEDEASLTPITDDAANSKDGRPEGPA